jgi:nucleoside-diphosphate-sugar epimerase
MRVFVAGANGAVGRRLVPMLVARGHRVTGTTTSEKSTERQAGRDQERAVTNPPPCHVSGRQAIDVARRPQTRLPEAIERPGARKPDT